MKKLAFLICLIVGVISISASAEHPRVENPRLLEKLEAMRNWKLMDVLDLSEQRAEKIFKILRKFDLKRRDLIKERRKIRKKIIDVAREKSSQEDITSLTERYLNIGVELAKLRLDELKALRSELTPEEEAKYIVFMERFYKEIMRMLSHPKFKVLEEKKH